MKILTPSEEYEASKQRREPLRAAPGYAAAVELLEAEADRLRAEYEQAAAKAASPYHLGSNSVEKAFKADELLAAATWLREQRHSAELTHRREKPTI